MVQGSVWFQRACVVLLLAARPGVAAIVETEPAPEPLAEIVAPSAGTTPQIGGNLTGWGGDAGALHGSDSLFLPIGSQMMDLPPVGLFDAAPVLPPVAGPEVP